VVGYAPLEEGINQEVMVEIDQEQSTPTLYAMVHQDTGEAGVYDFPDADPPVKTDGSVVVKPFQAAVEETDSQEMSIEVVDSAYQPGEITIAPGTTVVWTQTGSLPHTVTADDGSFDSGDMSSGDTFSFTFEEEGTYPYYCEYHGGPGGQGMAGVIIVGEGGGGMDGMDAEPTAAPEDEADSLY
jgi:plastocyanin